jgi:hypothetical protein
MLEGYFKQLCQTGYPATAGTLRPMPQTSNPFLEPSSSYLLNVRQLLPTIYKAVNIF